MTGRFSQHWHNVRATFALIRPVARFVRQRVAPDAARENIRRALDERAAAFLRLAESRIYGSESSPYLKLLRRAGCDYADLEAHVRSHGLEKTLEKLASEGVYLTAEEFKGKAKVLRGGVAFRVTPDDFALAAPAALFRIQSSSTMNPPVTTGISLDWLAARALAAAVFFDAHGLFSSAHAMYDAVLPSSGGVNNVLIYNRLGVTVERWFARAVPKRRGYLATYTIALAARLAGAGFPLPEQTGLGDVPRIVAWLERRRRQYRLRLRRRCGDGRNSRQRAPAGVDRARAAGGGRTSRDQAAALHDDPSRRAGAAFECRERRPRRAHRSRLRLRAGKERARAAPPRHPQLREIHQRRRELQLCRPFRAGGKHPAERIRRRPGDYQLREEEDACGNTRIALVVDPAVGAVDEQKLLFRLTAVLESDPWTARLWTDAGTLRVRRETPHASERGKILPLHIARRFGAS